MIKTSSNKKLKKLNTFGMEARADLYLEYDSPEDLASLDFNSLPQPLLQLGSGSNLLFTADFPGTVMHSAIKGIFPDEEVPDSSDNIPVKVGAGVVLDDLCLWAARKGWWGTENLSAIPGTVGAAAVQNAGAYGVEFGDIVESVECFDIRDRHFVTLSREDCAFGYRDSIFKHSDGRYIVVCVNIMLTTLFQPRLEYGGLKAEVERNVELSSPGSDPYGPLFVAPGVPPMPLSPMLVRDTVRMIRESKLPNPSKTGSAGSFFKNPVVLSDCYESLCKLVKAERGDEAEVPHFVLDDGKVKIPAAFLIDFCGLKGSSVEGASLWPSQPLVIVNTCGKATAADILSLEKKIIETVASRTGIVLSPEVEHIPNTVL